MSYQLFVSVIFFVASVLLLLMGTVVLRDNPRRRLNRITSTMLIFAALGPLFASLGEFFGGDVSQAERSSAITGLFYLWEFFFPQLILFSMVFPVELPFIRKYQRAKYLIFIPHVFHVALATLFYDPSRIINILTVENPPEAFKWLFDQFEVGTKLLATLIGALVRAHLELFAVVNFVYVVIASVLLYMGYKTVTNERLKTQTFIVIWGLRIAVGLYIVAFILPELGIFRTSEEVRLSLTIIGLLLGVGSIVYAIVRYQFLDIRVLVRQSLVYTITSGILVGVYMLTISQLGKLTRSVFGRDATIIDVAFVIAALIFFQPIMSAMDNLIKRFFIRDRADFRNLAEQFSRQLATVFDLDEIKSNVSRILREQMLVERVMFCIRDIGTDRYQASAEPFEIKELTRFSREDPLLMELDQHLKPVPFDDLKTEEVANSDCAKYLRDHRCQIIVPLHDDQSNLGFVGLSSKISGYSYNYEDITTLNILGNQLVTAVTNAKLYQESLEKQRLEKELAMARQIQNDLLPKQLPHQPGLEFAAYTEPARFVGGDYFDFLTPEPSRIGMIVADASGKGMPAALLIAQLQATLRSEVRFQKPISEMIASANYLISTSTSTEKFVTLFYGELNSKTLDFTYCNAGHNYPFVVRKDGATEYFETGGLIMGAFGNAKYQHDRFQLQPGDLLFFYTDGLNEAHNSKDEEFGDKRLVEFVKKNRDMGAQDLTDAVISEVRSFAGLERETEDDMTVIVLKIDEKFV